MCEIFAINAAQPVKAEPYLQEFFQDSVRHPHGWGLAWHEGKQARLYKEPVTAVESAYLDYLLGMDVCSPMLIAHIRNATRGIVSYANCHPFQREDAAGRRWTLCHNGTILSDALIEPFRTVQEGTTDSERTFLYLLDQLNRAMVAKGGELGFYERFFVLDRALADLAPGNKLNLVLDDGEYTYAHTNTDQVTLMEHRADGTTLLCSRPIGTGWEPLPRCQLVAYRDGEVACMGTAHGQTFDNDLYLQIIAMERNSSQQG